MARVRFKKNGHRFGRSRVNDSKMGWIYHCYCIDCGWTYYKRTIRKRRGFAVSKNYRVPDCQSGTKTAILWPFEKVMAS